MKTARKTSKSEGRKTRLIIDSLVKHWLFMGSLAGLVASSLYLEQTPHFSPNDFSILFLLFSLFVTVKGLEVSGTLENMAVRLEKGKYVALKLTLVTFFLSMVFTNDAALVVMVPITLAIELTNRTWLMILEALAANAGSALTPFGNPQNLFIFWHFDLGPMEFIKVMLPFSLLFLCMLSATALFLDRKAHEVSKGKSAPVNLKKGTVFLFSTLVVILAILKIIPAFSAAAVILLLPFLEPSCLKVDYGLLLTILCFMGISENFKAIFQTTIEHSRHVFLLSALSSQVISNVPAALLFAKFTTNWKALLWGTNVGGFGGLIGSLANLIAYKIYISSKKEAGIKDFTLKFMAANYACFLIGAAVFYVLRKYL